MSVRGQEELMAALAAVAREQAPFMLSLLLNATARDVQGAERQGIAEAFDRPKPFTLNAFGIKPSTKSDLSARVFAKDIQAKYLLPEVEGGTRQFKTFEERFASAGSARVALPGGGVKRDQYGGISKSQILRLARELDSSGRGKRIFRGVPKGNSHLPDGVYARIGTGKSKSIEPLLVFAPEAVYGKRFKFGEIATHTVETVFERNAVAAWERAVLTARR